MLQGAGGTEGGIGQFLIGLVILVLPMGELGLFLRSLQSLKN